MAPITKIFAPRMVAQHGLDHSGVFTWDIEADLFFADAAIANLFGIDVHEAEKGLPLLTYLNRIHPDDRGRAAKSIHDTILSGGPCQQDYRIVQNNGAPLKVMAFGRYFKGRNGVSTFYAGVIHEAPAEQSPQSRLRSYCLAAHTVAEMAGEAAIAEHLARALRELDRAESGESAVV